MKIDHDRGNRVTQDRICVALVHFRPWKIFRSWQFIFSSRKIGIKAGCTYDLSKEWNEKRKFDWWASIINLTRQNKFIHEHSKSQLKSRSIVEQREKRTLGLTMRFIAEFTNPRTIVFRFHAKKKLYFSYFGKKNAKNKKSRKMSTWRLSNTNVCISFQMFVALDLQLNLVA